MSARSKNEEHRSTFAFVLFVMLRPLFRGPTPVRPAWFASCRPLCLVPSMWQLNLGSNLTMTRFALPRPRSPRRPGLGNSGGCVHLWTRAQLRPRFLQRFSKKLSNYATQRRPPTPLWQVIAECWFPSPGRRAGSGFCSGLGLVCASAPGAAGASKKETGGTGTLARPAVCLCGRGGRRRERMRV